MFSNLKNVHAISADDFSQKIASYKNEKYKEISFTKKSQLPAGQTCVHLRKGLTSSQRAKIILKTLATVGLILLKSKERRTEFKNVFKITRNVKIFYSEAPRKSPSPSLVSELPASDSRIPDIAFGKAKWEKYFGDVGIEPPLPPDIDKILSSPCPIWGSEGKKVSDTHVLVLIPKTITSVVGGTPVTEPLTVNTLSKLVRFPKEGEATGFKLLKSSFTKEWENTFVKESYWVLMTKEPISGSTNTTYAEQEKLVANLSEQANVPYQVPLLLEATSSIFMTFVSSGVRLFGGNSPSATSCQEGVDNLNAVVGGFTYDLSLIYLFKDSTNDIHGVAAVRKL